METVHELPDDLRQLRSPSSFFLVLGTGCLGDLLQMSPCLESLAEDSIAQAVAAQIEEAR